MNSDLVGPSRLKAAFDQRCGRGGGGAVSRPVPDQCAVMGDGFFPAVAYYRHALAVARVTSNIAGNRAFRRHELAPDDGGINPFQRMGLELGGEAGVGFFCLGGDHQAAGVLVYAMHDAGTFLAPDSKQGIAAMGEERIDEGPVGTARGRVDHQARRFVDDDEMFIFINNVERDILCLNPAIDGGRDRHADFLAAFDLAGCICGCVAVHFDPAFAEKCLKAGPAHIRHESGQGTVEALACRVCRDLQICDAVSIRAVHVREVADHGVSCKQIEGAQADKRASCQIDVRSATRLLSAPCMIRRVPMTQDVPPLDPAQARMQRILKIVVASLGAMILLILGIIVVTVLGRMGSEPENREPTATALEQRVPAATVASGLVTLPEGGTVNGMTMADGLLALQVTTQDGGSQIMIIDLATGAVKSRLTLVEP